MLRLPRVLELTGLSRSSIYDMVESGTFPRQVKLGARAIAWRESDVARWLDERKAA
jgi:prophage regulatory protein